MAHYKRYQVQQHIEREDLVRTYFLVIDTFTDRIVVDCDTKDAAERMAAKLESER